MDKFIKLVDALPSVISSLRIEQTRMEKVLAKAPEGHLEINRNKHLGKTYYIQYFPNKHERKRIYLNKSKMFDLIEKLGDKKFATIALKNLNKNRIVLEKCYSNLRKDVGIVLANTFEAQNIPTTKQTCLSEKQRKELWLQKSKNPLIYKKYSDLRSNESNIIEPNIMTACGIQVRSKTEAFIANLLTEQNIAFKYEEALVLPNGSIKFPDFTLYNPYADEEFYWEHFGMMDNPDYANNALSKMEIYSRNGLNSKMLYTFESSKVPLQFDIIKEKLFEFTNSWKKY